MTVLAHAPGLSLGLSRDPAAVRAALALRRAVFVGEGRCDPDAESDAHDAHCDHLLLRDASGAAIGTTRIGTGEGPGLYVSREFDLSAPRAAERRIVEMGRTCLHPAHRGGRAAVMLLRGALEAARARGDLLLGVASIPGADATPLMPALAALEARALAPEALRPVAHGSQAVFPEGPADPAAMRAVPSLVKTYLRAGAWVGRGAWVDRPFGTVDVCMVLDVERAVLPGGLA